jgi:hypothetical protein
MGERLTANTSLAPIDDCRAVVAAYDGSKKATVAEAADTVRVMVGSYPQRAGAETPEIYLSAMIAAFADYTDKTGQIAARDIVKKHRFAPSVAEAVEALEAARSASATLAARARWALTEHERREREARREAELASITPERRAEQAQILANLARKMGGEQSEARS